MTATERKALVEAIRTALKALNDATLILLDMKADEIDQEAEESPDDRRRRLTAERVRRHRAAKKAQSSLRAVPE